MSVVPSETTLTPRTIESKVVVADLSCAPQIPALSGHVTFPRDTPTYGLAQTTFEKLLRVPPESVWNVLQSLQVKQIAPRRLHWLPKILPLLTGEWTPSKARYSYLTTTAVVSVDPCGLSVVKTWRLSPRLMSHSTC